MRTWKSLMVSMIFAYRLLTTALCWTAVCKRFSLVSRHVECVIVYSVNVWKNSKGKISMRKQNFCIKHHEKVAICLMRWFNETSCSIHVDFSPLPSIIYLIIDLSTKEGLIFIHPAFAQRRLQWKRVEKYKKLFSATLKQTVKGVRKWPEEWNTVISNWFSPPATFVYTVTISTLTSRPRTGAKAFCSR